MKKKLEADLISIAHRILQMKNKSDINLLLIETQKLQEKLSVLKFVEDYFGDTKPTIGQFEIEEKIAAVFENNTASNSDLKVSNEEIKTEEAMVDESFDEEIPTNEIKEEEEEVETDTKEEILSDTTVELEKPNVVGFTPAFELDVDFEEEPKKKPESVQISFEDLLGGNYNDALFVKVDSKENTPIAIENETIALKDLALPTDKQVAFTKTTDSKTVTLSETKALKIDLNDRIAFVKHLFGNSNEDYNRVLNQLITYDSFEEAQDFIEDMVKPDYNSWEGKEDYSQRFMEIIEKKFA